MKTFLIGDTHFDHKNVISYCDRPFDDVEEMNETLIKNWNSVVKDSDIVIHMGDIALGNKTRTQEFVKRLKGRKWLIMGNHDNFSIESYYNMGFERVYDRPIIYKDFYILSHKPMFMTKDMPYVNIYAHIHNNSMFEDRTFNTWCVSAERINYTPVNIEDFKVEFDTEVHLSPSKKRSKIYKDQEIFITLFQGVILYLMVRNGRVFIKAESMLDNSTASLEYNTKTLKIDDIFSEIQEILRDKENLITKKILSKIEKIND